MKHLLTNIIAGIFTSCLIVSNSVAFEIYNSDAPPSDNAQALPVLIKAAQLTDIPISGAKESEHYPFVEKALIDIELTNGANFAYPNLELVFFLYARSVVKEQVYLAGLGTHHCKIDRHQSYRYRTDDLFFGKDKKNFHCLPEYQTGDQYYGYIMAVFNGKQLVGLYTHPRFLKKYKNELYDIKTSCLNKIGSKRSYHCLTKEERKIEILQKRSLHF
ncbi:MAG: hypothetical protein Q8Q33_00570 [Chlamydiota bacterium]|nr:hypothetical protein [Chlamydiota bacterium]